MLPRLYPVVDFPGAEERRGLLGLIAGVQAGSISLLGWALGSVIEGLASVIVIWRLSGERTPSATAEARRTWPPSAAAPPGSRWPVTARAGNLPPCSPGGPRVRRPGAGRVLRIYPGVDFAADSPDAYPFRIADGEGRLLTAEDIVWFAAQYVAAATRPPPRARPRRPRPLAAAGQGPLRPRPRDRRDRRVRAAAGRG
jgi:hypothetical protein